MRVCYPCQCFHCSKSSLTSWDARFITRGRTVDDQFCWLGIQIFSWMPHYVFERGLTLPLQLLWLCTRCLMVNKKNQYFGKTWHLALIFSVHDLHNAKINFIDTQMMHWYIIKLLCKTHKGHGLRVMSEGLPYTMEFMKNFIYNEWFNMLIS